jgi:hypothetical protein
VIRIRNGRFTASQVGHTDDVKRGDQLQVAAHRPKRLARVDRLQELLPYLEG